jgi:hypothetical protein
MHCEEYPNKMDNQNPYYDLYHRDYIKRLEFARDNGCNTVMLTGTAEPQQNITFLREFGTMNQNIAQPFRWIEIQTTGVMMDKNVLRLLRSHVGVSTVSLSLSSFSNHWNQTYNGTPKQHAINIQDFCAQVKDYGFNLRLSLNMTSSFETQGMDSVLENISGLGADQATFRKLYIQEGTPQGEWIKKNGCSDAFIEALEDKICKEGIRLGILEYGQEQWSFKNVSYVFDRDCMAKSQKEALKYLILRPNARLYSRWDTTSSLIF